MIKTLEEFIIWADEKIKDGIKTKDSKLNAYRNLKSEVEYGCSNGGTVLEVLQKLYKTRLETAAIYKDTSRELYESEIIEAGILESLLPQPIAPEEIYKFLDTLGLEKVQKNFGIFKKKIEEKFQQPADSKIIATYLKS